MNIRHVPCVVFRLLNALTILSTGGWLATVSPTLATTYTWDGGGGAGDTAWSSGVNWVGDSPAVSATDTNLVFNYGSGLVNSTVDTAFTLHSIDFTPAAVAYHLTGQALNIEGTGTWSGDYAIISEGDTVTIDNTINLTGTGTGFRAYRGDLNLTGTINLSSGGYLLFQSESGRVLTSTGQIAAGGSSGLVFNGSGTTVISGSHTYTGGTSIFNGTVVINGNIASSSLTKLNGGTLAGSGTFGTTSIGDGSGSAGTAILAPGTVGTIGTMTTAGLDLNNSDAAFKFDLDSASQTWDRIDVTGGLTLGAGVAQLIGSDLGTTVLADGTVITLITTTTGISGTFAGLDEGSLLNIGNNQFRLSYGMSVANDLTLTVVPEPQTWLLMAAGLIGLVSRRRREISE